MSVLTWRGEKEGVFLREGFEDSQIWRSLKVVSKGSGASLKGKKTRHEEKELEQDEK